MMALNRFLWDFRGQNLISLFHLVSNFNSSQLSGFAICIFWTDTAQLLTDCPDMT